MFKLIGCLFLLLFTGTVVAQDFVTRGKIEYEIKRNLKRLNEEYDPEDMYNSAAEPDYDITYRDLTFTSNLLLYTPGRRGPKPTYYHRESVAYTDLGKKELVIKRSFGDDYQSFSDSFQHVKWRLQQETRKIAGWECRKAVGVIHDSVYVVAFYCPEIIPQGGPELFRGLPGMILGLAVPRHFTTWFATKVELANVDDSKIVPPAGKKGKIYGKRELAEIEYKKYKLSGWVEADYTLEKMEASMADYFLY